jgi:glutathione synthase/RimK-type ligase-like ATP-grasp enzyme
VSVVHLLTGESMPKPDTETHGLTAALERLGIRSRVLAWTDPAVGAGADLVVVRTPWDYIDRCDEFLAVCRGARVPVLNAPDVLAWNSHKRYLVELARAGVPVVPTRLVQAGEDAALTPDEHSAALVVKPAVSSGSRGAERYEPGDPAAPAHLAALVAQGDALVQPYVESVADRGERSLIFLGGEFSHAVDKVPVRGDYRVQEMYGGRYRVHSPTAAESAVAEHALAAADARALLYARVDLVEGPEGPQVMELELIEPELFLGFHEQAPQRLAEAIAQAAAGQPAT